MPEQAETLVALVTGANRGIGLEIARQLGGAASCEAPAGRIVNVSSGSGSLTLTGSPDWPREWSAAAYPASKAAVNALTVQFAAELRDTAIKVNAVDPGYTRTDMSPAATRTPADAAAVVVRYATLDADGPTGAFFNEHGALPW